ncbi:RNA polymerase II transcriptional coactivator KIWI [Triticum urartu]|uniref:RNA polymerase II transcriptional coactivator KIWI n=1 Tax=Triticum urartu TaxID=4572 RepID=M7YNX4_TRIUA|nr:RNA polymerase II transcriptional coactivator KIWI [Triticum urartu]
MADGSRRRSRAADGLASGLAASRSMYDVSPHEVTKAIVDPQSLPLLIVHVIDEISKNKRVAVRSWNGKVMVDMREFYEKDGKSLPTRKGISLSMDQWKILRDNIEAIDEAIKENT